MIKGTYLPEIYRHFNAPQKSKDVGTGAAEADRRWYDDLLSMERRDVNLTAYTSKSGVCIPVSEAHVEN